MEEGEEEKADAEPELGGSRVIWAGSEDTNKPSPLASSNVSGDT